MSLTIARQLDSLRILNPRRQPSTPGAIGEFQTFGGRIHPTEFARISSLPKPSGAQAPAKLEPVHGTTTLGMVFKDGVVIATDSRSTQGPFVASQTVKKILEISQNIIGTMAGGAADCAFWEDNLSRQIRLFELRHKRPVTVAAAAQMLANTLFQYAGMGLSVGTMISGVDVDGPHIYYVDNDGARLAGRVFSVGSGSTYAYGVMDQEYSPDMDEETAVKLARKSIFHATHRDAMSGGYINIYVIKREGWRRVPTEDCYHVFYGEEEPGVRAN